MFRDVRARRSIVYTSNNTIDPWLQKAVVRAITAIQEGKDPIPLEPPAVIDIAAADRSRLAGRWTMPGGTAQITANGESLAMAHHGVSYRMVPVGSSAFYVPGLDVTLGFANSADGRVTRMHVSTSLTGRWERRVR